MPCKQTQRSETCVQKMLNNSAIHTAKDRGGLPKRGECRCRAGLAGTLVGEWSDGRLRMQSSPRWAWMPPVRNCGTMQPRRGSFCRRQERSESAPYSVGFTGCQRPGRVPLGLRWSSRPGGGRRGSGVRRGWVWLGAWSAVLRPGRGVFGPEHRMRLSRVLLQSAEHLGDDAVDVQAVALVQGGQGAGV